MTNMKTPSVQNSINGSQGFRGQVQGLNLAWLCLILSGPWRPPGWSAGMVFHWLLPPLGQGSAGSLSRDKSGAEAPSLSQPPVPGSCGRGFAPWRLHCELSGESCVCWALREHLKVRTHFGVLLTEGAQ